MKLRRLSKDELVILAREYANSQGWPWTEPIIVQRGLFRALVRTNCQMKGSNVNVHMNVRTGEVVHSGFARR